MTTLEQLNSCDAAAFTAALQGIYEHSPWIPQRAAAQRPFPSVAALKQALQQVVDNAAPAEQLALIRAHPELAGKAAIAGRLTAESTAEQARAGLASCSPEELATLQRLNADYNARFGFPFILAVKGRTREAVIAAFEQRLGNRPEDELREALSQIARIAAMRIDELAG